MRLGGEPVGRWGLGLLVVAAVVGALLAWLGWTGRGAGAVPVLSAGGVPASAAPGTAGPGSTGPDASPSASASATVGASGGKAGPLLSAEPFANMAFQIWPGKQSAAAQAALTGLQVDVRREAAGVSVVAGVNGQTPGPAHFYPGGTRVYVVEASMGDDSGNSDYNLGDDGLVVTDAQGRIIR